ncbi:hypothetical protein N7466_005527 [Penicillium verhagenii]|uniref:uncharacterized protein n=1 Tax=Penicillium verhagenii TaxID=1562060 RepID=UPI00254524BD|nr:uncharacterized protein N7466_005527 [Penicillium verhagenii]KAJ5930034.1 hypothetical protein N7466_005527 [Penicillium verhagenii]
MASPVDAKLLRKTKFPPEFSRKVDMNKVNIEVMKKWISGRISEILGNEDDVVIALCFNLIEGIRYPDIKAIQIQLTGFLDKDTPKFCQDLWSLCLSGQENPQGVPKELLEAKKLELIQEKLEAEKAAEAARQQRDEEAARERELGDIRNRERGNRGNRGDYGRGQRGPGGGRSRDDHFDRRRSRSPRNRSRDRYPLTDAVALVPLLDLGPDPDPDPGPPSLLVVQLPASHATAVIDLLISLVADPDHHPDPTIGPSLPTRATVEE